MEFHPSMNTVLFGIAASHLTVVALLIYLLSSLYRLYAIISQLDIMHRKIDWLVDPCAVSTTSQDEAWDYLYIAMLTWVSSTLFYMILIKLWWRDESTLVTTMRKLDTFSWICILNSFTVVLSTSFVEFWFTRSISNDWGVSLYFLLAVSFRFAHICYQGKY